MEQTKMSEGFSLFLGTEDASEEGEENHSGEESKVHIIIFYSIQYFPIVNWLGTPIEGRRTEKTILMEMLDFWLWEYR